MGRRRSAGECSTRPDKGTEEQSKKEGEGSVLVRGDSGGFRFLFLFYFGLFCLNCLFLSFN